MFASTQRMLARIGRWPRRLAALVCLLLAAGSALVPPHAVTTGEHGLASRLHAGEVAVPVPISSAAPVRPDELVGVLAAPDDGSSASAVVVADRLRVLSVQSGGTALSSDSAAVIIVAADRARAVQLARYSARRLVLIVDDLP